MTTYGIDVDALHDVLAGRSLNQVDPSLLETKAKMPFRAGVIRFAPEAKLSIRVLSRPEHRDEDAVFGDGKHIAFDLESAWVKYKLTTNHDARATVAPASAKLGAGLELSDYRMHRATEDAWQSLRGDLVEPRTLLEIADVKKLQPGEALALEAGGTLTTSIGFSWSDAIAEHLRDLQRGLPALGSVTVKLHAGLECEAEVRLEDQFILVISRALDGPFRVAIKKARSRNHSLAIEVSLGAELNALPAIEDALAPAFEALTGVALETAERIANTLGIGDLTTDEAKIAERIAAFFGLATSEGREQAVRDAIDDLRRELRERLVRIARFKAATTFGAEYASVEENTSIADYLIDDLSELERDHAVLLAGDFGAIARSLRSNAGTRTLLRYLNETTLTRRSSSGFSLQVGKFHVEAKDESVLRLTTRSSIDGFKLLHYRGTQRYEERLIPQNDFEWSVELRATMPEFVEQPCSRDFRYLLRYVVTLERGTLSEADLSRMIDFARMWRIPIDDDSLLASAIGKKGVVRAQCRFDGDDLSALLDPQHNADDWPTALAAAMPYASFFPERRTHAARIATYREAWQAWLEDPSADVTSMVCPKIRSGLSLLEERDLPGSFRWTAETGHPQLRRRLDAFARGAATLHAAITTPRPHECIAAAYEELRHFWSQRLYVAASGQWLLARAERAGIDANRSLQIDLGNTTLTV